MADQKPSAVEGLKLASNYLRGDIARELSDGNAFFAKPSTQLLKHHGTYQQDDRDEREGREGAKSQKHYSFMVRTKIPGGKLTSRQLLAELDLCDELANSTLRITTRQGLQLHGVLKDNLKRAIKRINEVQLSTLAACGDVERNIMCCPAPHHHDPVHQQMQDLADRLAVHLCPRTTAYYELWLRDSENGEETLHGGGSQGHEIEPIYGPTYLPRKFKTAIGLPGDNCVDIYTHDLGLLAICDEYRIVGYNVLVGGGFWHHAQREEDLSRAGQANGAGHARAGGRRGHGGDQGAARFRQSLGPQSRADEVPDRRLGPGAVQSQGRGILRPRSCPIRIPTTCAVSTTTWAGTSRATASCSMA